MNLLTILVFVLIIVLVYAVYKLMTKTTTTVSGFSDASRAVTVPSNKIGSRVNYGFSVWVYIDAWQNTATTPGSGSSKITYKKNILTRCNGKAPVFTLHLDNDQNNLMLEFPGITTATPCTIQNVKLQKWFNIIMSVYGNTVDLYLDGKLVRTCILPGPPKSPSNSDIVQVGGGDITCSAPDAASAGDLIGYISSVVYKDDYFTPEEAWDIYSAGYSGSGMFDFIHRYKLNFSLLKDNQTMGTVSI